MASPNVVYLSQSLLSEDESFRSRLSHEVSHGWFGLSIGALDWTEEWLSEGFATFLEDVIHARAQGISNMKDLLEIKEYIRKKTLLQEIENTNEDLQILRSSQGKKTTVVVDELNATVLKNGQNKIKNFTQVHYIKGYFLLKNLSCIVGLENFLEFLKFYVKKFEGQLVTSKEFLSSFLDFFPCKRNSLTVEGITEKWLHDSGINMEILAIEPSVDNELFKVVQLETKKWKTFNCSSMKKRTKKQKCSLDNFTKLSADQSVLLLEYMLEEENLSSRTLDGMEKVFKFSETNAEVQHRWFELVVKHNYRRKYKDLEYFLLNHLAMGVYLYGELIHSGDKEQHDLARKCFDLKKSEMESNFRQTIQEMFDDEA